MHIYRNDIRNLIVQDFDITPNGVKIVKTRSVVVKDNAPFYSGLGHSKISFDYGTVLCSENEALDYLSAILTDKPSSSIRTCLYTTDQFVSEEISRQEFKQLKKTYREIRKNRD